MGKPIKIRNVATGRDDEYVAEVVSADGSRALLGIATAAEVTAGTDTNKIVSPALFAGGSTGAVSAASTTAAGKVELATNTEALEIMDTSRAVTPAGLGAALDKLMLISFTGKSGTGACTATGLAVDDLVIGVAGLTDMGLGVDYFETVITVADQIQQLSGSNLSAKNFVALVYSPAVTPSPSASASVSPSSSVSASSSASVSPSSSVSVSVSPS